MKDYIKTILWGVLALVIGFFFAKYLAGDPVSNLLLVQWGKDVSGYLIHTDEEYIDGDSGGGWEHWYVYKYAVAGKTYEGEGHGSGPLKPEYSLIEEPIPIQVRYFTGYPRISKPSESGAQSLFEWFWREFCLALFIYALVCAPGVSMIRTGLRERRKLQKQSQ